MNKLTDKVFVVIPVHNRMHYTNLVLDCLYKQTWENLHIIVIDDGSTDGTSEMIMRKYPHCSLLRSDGDLWWTGAINKGIKYALMSANSEDYILVINDDLEIGPHYVKKLVETAKIYNNSIIGSVEVDLAIPNIIYKGGVFINDITAKRTLFNRGKSLSNFADGYVQEVSTLSGRGTLIPIKVFNILGIYDDIHFKQCGDFEFPIRAKNKGFNLLVSYDAVVFSYIHESASINVLQSYRFKDYKTYFFDIRSNARLKYRYYLGKAVVNNNATKFAVYLLCDVIRLHIHFILGLYQYYVITPNIELKKIK